MGTERREEKEVSGGCSKEDEYMRVEVGWEGVRQRKG